MLIFLTTMISKEEKEQFFQAMKGVRPLSAGAKNRKNTPAEKLPTLRRRKNSPPPLEHSWVLDNLRDEEWVKIDETLSFNRSGLQTKTLKKLSKGSFAIEARMDLHRMTVDQAIYAADQFISRCQQQSLRHLLLIHGKGKKNEKPLLKNAIFAWLKENPKVLALHSAIPKDGGAGALYVLIKLC